MSCERFSEAIAGHAAGGEISAAAAAHQASCESCAARLATQRRLLTDVDAELARTLSLSASPEFVARVTSRVTAPGRSVVWRPAAVWVGLAAAAAIAVAAVLRGPAPAVSPMTGAPATPRESAVASAPVTTPAIVETGALSPTDRRPAVRRSQPRPSRQVAAPVSVQGEPPVIVSPDQVRAIARLHQLVNAGRINEKTLPPERPHQAAELVVAPLEIPDIKVPDVEFAGRPPGSAVEQEPEEH